jgi:hypothetical protein
MKKIFLSFASSDLHRSLSRIKQEAINMGVYDKTSILTEIDLDDDFKKQFKPYLTIGSRGYGYWCWKPQIILQTLADMNDGDILQYTDAGCRLNVQGKHRLDEYFEITANSASGMLAFQTRKPDPPLVYDGRNLLDLRDYKWTKGDLLDYFDVRYRDDITNTPTIGAGIIFIRKCDASLSLIKKWLKTIEDNFAYIDDTPSVSQNLDGFIEHRHDQSIFSILCKINNIETLSAYEYWYPSKKKHYKPDWDQLRQFPIHARRDMDYGPIRNLKNVFFKFIGKVNRIIWHGKQIFSHYAQQLTGQKSS